MSTNVENHFSPGICERVFLAASGLFKPPTSSIPVFFGHYPENEPSYSPLHPGAIRSHHSNPLCRVTGAFQQPPLPKASLNSLALRTACCIINKAPSSTTFFSSFSQSVKGKRWVEGSLCAWKVGQGPSNVLTAAPESQASHPLEQALSIRMPLAVSHKVSNCQDLTKEHLLSQCMANRRVA